MIGLKFLREDGTSLNGKVKYPLDGTWTDVPGNGAYVAMTDGLHSISIGDIIAAMGCDKVTEITGSHGVMCFRRVCVMKYSDTKQSQILWKVYDEAIVSAWEMYDEAKVSAWKLYDAAIALNETRESAWEMYDEAVAPASKMYYKARAFAFKNLIAAVMGDD